MKMKFKDLKDPKIQARLKDAKTPDDLVKIAKEFDINLSDDELDAIVGGIFGDECSGYSCMHTPCACVDL